MSAFMAVRALSGLNYVRADMVMAVAASEATKCSVYLMGGVTIHCSEPAKDVVARLEELVGGRTGAAQEEPK
jgi:hypothetical protein